jgi:hypothetical protein
MKNSRSLTIVVALLILSGLSVYLYFSKSKAGISDKEGRNFSYKDTAAITKIFIADKEGNQSTVVRTKTGWVVNDKFACRTEAILNLLEVIKNMEVKMSVPKEAVKNVIKLMATRATKVEIYTNDGLVKQYYVGHATEDSEGSYMLLTDVGSGENYKEPYVCFIPGFKGYLRPRFIAKENDWRDRIVINYTPPEIKEISVKHLTAPKDSSFTIELLDTKTFRLKNANGAALPFDEAKLKQYLVYFQNNSYEALITNRNKKLQDSLAAQMPFCVITITTTKFTTDTYKFFRKQFLGDINPDLGTHYDFDPDRLYLRFDNGKEWALGQYFTFGKLFVSRNYFTPSTVKK